MTSSYRLRFGLLFVLFLVPCAIGKHDKDDDLDEIASAISGMYREFNVADIYTPIILGARLFDDDVDRLAPLKFDRQGVCPSELKLKVKEKKGELKIKLPKDLKAVNGDCPPAPGFKKKKVELVDYSKHPGLPEVHLHEGEFYVSSLPYTLIQCPGDDAPPFTGLQLSSLKRLLAPKIRSILRQLKAPEFIADQVFGNKIQRDTTHASKDHDRWNIPYVKRVVKGAKKEMEKLDEYFVLILNRMTRSVSEDNSELSDPIAAQLEKEMAKGGITQAPFGVVRQLSTDHPNCVYLLDGLPAEAEIKKKMEMIVTSLLPLFGHSRWSNMPIPSLTLYPTASRCVPNQKRSIQSLTLSKPPTQLAAVLSETDLVNWFTISVNGEACSSARMESVLEMDYHPTKSAMGLTALSLSRELISFLEEQRMAKRGRSTSPLRIEYPDLASRLLDSIAKASIFAAKVDLGSCFQVENRRSVDLLIVHRPAAHLYCNGFPRLGSNFSYNCAIPPSELEGSIAKQYSAFLVQDKTESNCVYSSSEFSAAILRGDIAIPSAEPEGTVDPVVIGDAQIDVLPTLLPTNSV